MNNQAENRRGRTVCIIQARYESSRLPGKAMLDLNGQPVLARVVQRVRSSKRLDDVVLAIGDVPTNAPLVSLAKTLGVQYVEGSENDVLSRFVLAARRTDAAVVVRITADCPLVDPNVVDQVVAKFHNDNADFVSNTQSRSFPDGLDVEVFSTEALFRADEEARDPFLRSHVTPYIHGRLKDRFPWGGFTVSQVVHPQDFSFLRWTLDEEDDLVFLQAVYAALSQESFGWMDVIALLTRNPHLLRMNSGHAVYEGTERDIARRSKPSGGRSYAASEAQFQRACRVIPTGTQTFSKSYYQWPKGSAPLFLARSRGCRTWDIDGNEYIDYVLGLLPIILGHCDVDVEAAVERQLSRGVTFSLATELEAELAELLVNVIPSAEMVRFGKNGSDATSAAIRLARAYTGRDRVAVSGYHGWHDWYIGTTARNLGVPEAVCKLSSQFPFGDAGALERLLVANDGKFAAVILEADGVAPPPPGFLAAVRRLCDKHGVLLVFDEIVSGFRTNIGGAQARFGVTPDLSTFGKAMGNGYPISAVVGRSEVMKLMDDVFVSGTFAGDAIALSASIATIRKLQRDDVPTRLSALGTRLIERSNGLIAKHGLTEIIAFQGNSWWPRIVSKPGLKNPVIAQSLLRQALCSEGLLMGASYNLCLAHDNPRAFDQTVARLDRALAFLADAFASTNPEARLTGDPIRAVFSVR